MLTKCFNCNRQYFKKSKKKRKKKMKVEIGFKVIANNFGCGLICTKIFVLILG